MIFDRAAVSMIKGFVPEKLLRPGAAQDGGNRAQENLEVEPERPVVNVFEVEAHPFLEVGNLVAALDLPETGEAGLDAQTAAVREIAETADLVHRQRARANEAHLAAQD